MKNAENLKSKIPEITFLRLKEEIDNLVTRVSYSTKKENEYLKNRVALLERQNLKLMRLLYGCNGSLKVFVGDEKKNIN